ncbi:MAG TPA: PHP domain-containing protein [Synergistales bacterium]|nr:PHP domain-containing protein [Synergistales bacterium]
MHYHLFCGRIPFSDRFYYFLLWFYPSREAASQIIIDIHVHTAEFSVGDSYLRIEDAIRRAKAVGLDGVCFTDHESIGVYEIAADLSRRYDFLVIPGIEILTFEGDLLVFGLDEVPQAKMHARELISHVRAHEGIAISAHPFRDNGRGMGHHLPFIDDPLGIEVLNGRTREIHNLQAYKMALRLGYPCLGGSDAHTVHEVGSFATRFRRKVLNLEDFISHIRNGEVSPVALKNGRYVSLQNHIIRRPVMHEPLSQTAFCMN